jgi:hypothetical protein
MFDPNLVLNVSFFRTEGVFDKRSFLTISPHSYFLR